MANYKGYFKDKDGNSIVPAKAEILTVDDIVCKNLMPIFNYNRTIYGISFTVNNDKSITLKGTATDYADFYLINSWGSNSIFKTLNGTYTLSLGINNPDIIFYLVNITTVVTYTTSQITKNFTNQDITCAMIRVNKGATVDTTVYPQLEKGPIKTNHIGYKEFNNKQTYYLYEHVVGTWIDGKPIYRKVFYNYFNDEYNNWYSIGSITNLQTVIKVAGMIKQKNDGNFIDFPRCSTFDNTSSDLYINGSTGEVNIRNGKATGDLYLIVEYTKTTD